MQIDTVVGGRCSNAGSCDHSKALYDRSKAEIEAARFRGVRGRARIGAKSLTGARRRNERYAPRRVETQQVLEQHVLAELRQLKTTSKSTQFETRRGFKKTWRFRARSRVPDRRLRARPSAVRESSSLFQSIVFVGSLTTGSLRASLPRASNGGESLVHSRASASLSDLERFGTTFPKAFSEGVICSTYLGLGTRRRHTLDSREKSHARTLDARARDSRDTNTSVPNIASPGRGRAAAETEDHFVRSSSEYLLQRFSPASNERIDLRVFVVDSYLGLVSKSRRSSVAIEQCPQGATDRYV